MDTTKITLSAALQSYYNDEFIALWNTAAKENGLAHLTFAATTTNRASLNVANKVAAKKLAEALVNGKKKAGYAAFNANIRAAQQIVAALEDGASIISLAAVTQSGKTHVMTFAWLGHQINLIRQGKPQELCYIVTNRSVPVLEATRNDFQQYINAHHGLRFHRSCNDGSGHPSNYGSRGQSSRSQDCLVQDVLRRYLRRGFN